MDVGPCVLLPKKEKKSTVEKNREVCEWGTVVVLGWLNDSLRSLLRETKGLEL